MEETDEHVARRVQGGDADAFGVLIDRYEAKLRRYARRFLARDDEQTDIVQDVFVKAYTNIQGFDISARFSPWIYRIAHNTCMDELRLRKRGVISLDFDTLLSHSIVDEGMESERERAHLAEEMDQALSKIPPKYREVLVLYFYQGLSYAEIADILEVPIGTVGIRIKRAKEALKTNVLPV